MCVWSYSADAAPVIAAYQEIYRMNFEVLPQIGLPSSWYVTFDGYPVAQVRPNHWVYGTAHQGVLVPTEVAVGAVVPMNVPQLARVAVSSWRCGVYDTKQFRTIALSGLDNMGVLDDPLAYTPIAWKSGEAGFRIWLGDRWYRIAPAAGQSSSQALMAQHPYIIRTLNEKNAIWSMSDTQELADLAREWGYLWRGHIPFASLQGYRDSGSTERTVKIGGSVVGAPDDGSSGQWDIGGDSTGTGGGGGGWDSGGTNSGNTGGGGGWSGGNGNTGGGGAPGGGSSSGGGWDK